MKRSHKVQQGYEVNKWIPNAQLGPVNENRFFFFMKRGSSQSWHRDFQSSTSVIGSSSESGAAGL